MFEWSRHVAERAAAATFHHRPVTEPRPTITEAEFAAECDRADADGNPADGYELIG
ncbi:hypothetical protein [Nocardia stercoris]|uniref:hypothetical protein n=1 Tax=Nocardia stercoris TaxID=2483361 RepID=UPI001319F6DE|nr:hypothetical protein [Nocardia stercoris]